MPSASTVAEYAVVVTADTDQAEKALSDLGTKVGSAGSALQTAFAGAAIAGITAVGTGLAASVVAAADFEKTMSGVKAVSGATAEEMAALQQTALDLGAKTAFSASEAGKGIEELVKGGLTVQEAMLAAEATLNLAAAGGVSVADSATIAANALAQFGLKGSDMAHVSDLIAGAANASALDVGQFKYSLQAAGAVAATVGFSFDDLAQGIAVMGKAGITGSDAGTSLKTMMMSLQPSTKKTSELFRELGLITEDGANQFFTAEGSVKSMAEVAQVLQDSLAGMTDAQRIATLETLFGSDAVRAGAVLAKEGAAGFNDMAAAMGKVTSESVGAEKLNNLNGAVEGLKGSLETMAIMIGLELLPILTDLVKAVTQAANDAMPSMQAAAKSLAETLKAWIPTLKALAEFLWDNRDAIMAVGLALATFAIMTTVVGWVMAVAGAVSAVTAAISASGGILAALGALVAILGGPVTLIIAAVAVAVGALAYAWANNWGDIQGKTEAVVDFLSGVPAMVEGFFTDIGNAAQGLQWAIDDAWANIREGTLTLWDWVKQFLETWWRVILVVLTGPIGAVAVLIIDNWTAIKTKTAEVWDAIKTFLTDWWRVILIALTGPVGALAVLIIDNWTAIKTKTAEVWDAIALYLGQVWGAITTAIGQVFTAAGTGIVAVVTTGWEAVSKSTADAYNGATTGITAVVSTGWEAVSKSTADAYNAATTGIVAVVTTGWEAVSKSTADAYNGATTGIVSVVSTGWEAVSKSTADAYNAATTGIVAVVSTGWGLVKGGIDAAFGAGTGDTITGLVAAGWAAVVGVTKALLSGDAADSLNSAVAAGWGAVVTQIKALGQAGSELLNAATAVGAGIITSIQEGIQSKVDWFQGQLKTQFIDKIPDYVKELLGIHSPSSVMYDIGVSIVEGLWRGMSAKLPSIDELIKRVVGDVSGMSGDVDAWLRAALAYTHAPESWLEPLKWIVAHESGGDPTAKNPDSTASGLFQIIDSTWAASRDKSLPNEIFNPIINAVGGIRYIRGRYGDPFEAVDFWKKNNHYAEGGWAGLRGPELAWLGERGPEYVVPNSALSGGGAPMQSVSMPIVIGNRVIEELWITGRDLAIRRGRVPGAGAASMGSLS